MPTTILVSDELAEAYEATVIARRQWNATPVDRDHHLRHAAAENYAVKLIRLNEALERWIGYRSQVGPGARPYCCFDGCFKDATWDICYGTHGCDEHAGALLDDSVRHRLPARMELFGDPIQPPSMLVAGVVKDG